MSNLIKYRSERALQICIVFSTTLFIERLLQFNRAGWIGFVVMMIYVGFDAGASMHRTLHRFWGTVIGLLLSVILWKIGLWDFRLMMTVIPVVVFLSFFALGKFYAYPTIFTVTLTSLGTTYFSPSNYDAYYLFFDYFKATVVAFFICMIFEGIIFKNKKMSQVFYQNLEQIIIKDLEQLFEIVLTKPIKRNHFLKISAHCHAKIQETYVFEQTAQHDYALQKEDLQEAETFHVLVTTTLEAIRKLYLLAPHNNETLVNQVQTMMAKLRTLYTSQGVLSDGSLA